MKLLTTLLLIISVNGFGQVKKDTSIGNVDTIPDHGTWYNEYNFPVHNQRYSFYILDSPGVDLVTSINFEGDSITEIIDTIGVIKMLWKELKRKDSIINSYRRTYNHDHIEVISSLGSNLSWTESFTYNNDFDEWVKDKPKKKRKQTGKH